MNNKTTLKEFFDSKDKLAIHCYRKEDAKILLKAFHELGEVWFSGDSYLDNDCWEGYREKTVYCNNNYIGNIDDARRSLYKVYEFSDVILEDNNEKKLCIDNFHPKNMGIYVNNVKLFSTDKRTTIKTENGYEINPDGVHSKEELIQMLIDKIGMLEDAFIDAFVQFKKV